MPRPDPWSNSNSLVQGLCQTRDAGNDLYPAISAAVLIDRAGATSSCGHGCRGAVFFFRDPSEGHSNFNCPDFEFMCVHGHRFGLRLAMSEYVPSLRASVTLGEVMNKLVDSSRLKYAVIVALRTEGRPECVVLGYPDEESLRDLIAAPSIAALGFASREKAVASIEGCFPLSAGSTAVVDEVKKRQREFHSAMRRLAEWFSLAGSRRIAHRAMQHALAAAILAFYSRNVVAATIRTIFGSSFC
jgi:hypothetical protein